jgi:hypothetical protein
MAKKSLAEMQPQAKNDAYTVMLTISLVAMIAACILLYQELKRYPSLKPPAQLTPPPATLTPPGAEGGIRQPTDDSQTPKDAKPADEKKPEGGGEAKPEEKKNP